MNKCKNVSGPYIRIERERRGWTQKELADEMKRFGTDLSETLIQKIENQTRQVYDRELYAFARVLDVSYEYLLGIHDCAKEDEKNEILVETQK